MNDRLLWTSFIIGIKRLQNLKRPGYIVCTVPRFIIQLLPTTALVNWIKWTRQQIGFSAISRRDKLTNCFFEGFLLIGLESRPKSNGGNPTFRLQILQQNSAAQGTARSCSHKANLVLGPVLVSLQKKWAEYTMVILFLVKIGFSAKTFSVLDIGHLSIDEVPPRGSECSVYFPEGGLNSDPMFAVSNPHCGRFIARVEPTPCETSPSDKIEVTLDARGMVLPTGFEQPFLKFAFVSSVMLMKCSVK